MLLAPLQSVFFRTLTMLASPTNSLVTGKLFMRAIDREQLVLDFSLTLQLATLAGFRVVLPSHRVRQSFFKWPGRLQRKHFTHLSLVINPEFGISFALL